MAGKEVTNMRTTLVVGLVLLLMMLALPATGTTEQLDTGATLISGDVLAPAGTSHATVKYVESIIGTDAVTPIGTGGHRNIAE